MKQLKHNEYWNFMLPYLPIIGGAQTQAHGLATALKNLDNEVTVYASKKCVNNIKTNGWVFNYKLKPCNSPSILC